jgi:hypothetical protein
MQLPLGVNIPFPLLLSMLPNGYAGQIRSIVVELEEHGHMLAHFPARS